MRQSTERTQRLELSKNFEAAILEMFQQVIIKPLETNEKLENLSK